MSVAPFIAGYGHGVNANALAVPLTKELPVGSTAFVAVTDGYGYSVSAESVVDALGAHVWSAIYLQNQVQNDGSVFLFGTPITTDLPIGTNITMESDNPWQDFQMTVVGFVDDVSAPVSPVDLDAFAGSATGSAMDMTTITFPQDGLVFGVAGYENATASVPAPAVSVAKRAPLAALSPSDRAQLGIHATAGTGDSSGAVATGLTPLQDAEETLEGQLIQYARIPQGSAASWSVAPNSDGYGAAVMFAYPQNSPNWVARSLAY